MDFRIAFGQVLRTARKSKSLSQEQLGFAAGLHLNTVSKMERGEFSPSVVTVVAVCAALGFEPWEMFLEASFLADEPVAVPGNHDVHQASGDNSADASS